MSRRLACANALAITGDHVRSYPVRFLATAFNAIVFLHLHLAPRQGSDFGLRAGIRDLLRDITEQLAFLRYVIREHRCDPAVGATISRRATMHSLLGAWREHSLVFWKRDVLQSDPG